MYCIIDNINSKKENASLESNEKELNSFLNIFNTNFPLKLNQTNNFIKTDMNLLSLVPLERLITKVKAISIFKSLFDRNK